MRSLTRILLTRCPAGEQRCRANEIPDADKEGILREYLRRWKWEVGQFFDGVGPQSPAAELERIAPDHPVFRIEAV